MDKELSTEELGRGLRAMYEDAPRWDKVSTIILFGIQYADQIGRWAGEIAIAVGIGDAYGKEVATGKRLARYVTINDDRFKKVGSQP